MTTLVRVTKDLRDAQAPVLLRQASNLPPDSLDRYGRDGREWQLVHRHADPLVNRITVPQAAALARGTAP